MLVSNAAATVPAGVPDVCRTTARGTLAAVSQRFPPDYEGNIKRLAVQANP
jgi:hypothetical protein